jgi:arginase
VQLNTVTAAHDEVVKMAGPLGVIGVPSSAGAFAPGQEQAPRALRDAGLIDRLTQAGIHVVDHGDSPVWRWRPDRTRRYAQNLEAVVEQVQALAERVRRSVAAGEVPLVLGGDCTLELGTVSGFLPSDQRLTLLYFDLHADLNVPDSAPDGALDWMGMAHMLGEERATPELSRFGPRFPLLADEDVLIFAHGPGQVTPWEREVLERRNLQTIPVSVVTEDPEGAAALALARLAGPDDRLLVHFDVDVIDFTDAPLSENTGRNIGLSFEHAFRALRVILANSNLAALTITELNPQHGEPGAATLERYIDALVGAVEGSPVLART